MAVRGTLEVKNYFKFVNSKAHMESITEEEFNRFHEYHSDEDEDEDEDDD